MPFCVNCGSKYSTQPSICESCLLDPTILEATLDAKLGQSAYTAFSNGRDFSYFGERTSLALSIIILGVFSLILGTLSFGIFFILILLSLFNLKILSLKAKGLMVPLSKNNYPDLFRLVKVICYRLKVPLLPVYICQDENYNAHTQGFLGDAWVVINSSIVEDFTPNELAFIIGHEFAHIKRRHTTWLTLMSPASGGLSSVLTGITRLLFNFWSLKCEHTADRGGLLAIRDINAVVSALLKLVGGSTAGSHIDWKKLIKDHDDNDNLLLKATELMGTHPFPIRRIREVYRFSCSKKYKSFYEN